MIYLFLLFIILINEIILRKNFLFDRIEFSKHKSFANLKKVPTSGGLFLILFIFIFENNLGTTNLLYFSLIFLIGLSSDRIKNLSPVIRLFLQIFITFLFIINTETIITDVRIDNINYIFEKYKSLAFIFTIFCFIVLMNGTNFIDGINLNTTGFYVLIYSSILIVSKINNLNLDQTLNIQIILFLIIIYFLNFLNKAQLGDSGSYLLAFYTAFYVINFVNINPLVSPYYIILILWYPCFENLFSIFRKIYQKKSISSADNLHLHHNIFIFLKINNFKNINNLSGLILNFVNLFLILLGIYYFNSTKHLILIIFINICIYVFTYNILIKTVLSKKFTKK